MNGERFPVLTHNEDRLHTLWPELQGWFSDVELRAYFDACDGVARVLEIGCWKGRSTMAAARAAGMVLAVDTWRGDAYTGPGWFFPEFVANCQAFEASNVFPLMMDFRRALPMLAPILGTFDVVLYDACHDYETTAAAFDLLLPYIRTDTPVLVHDYSPAYRQVQRACAEACEASGRIAYRVDTLAALVRRDKLTRGHWNEA